MITSGRYVKIILVWFFILTFIGFVLAGLGVGRGGASGIFLLLAMILGLVIGGVHISVLSLIKGSKTQKVWVPTITAILFLSFYFHHASGIKNGYRSAGNDEDYIYIVKDGSWVVRPTIVSYDTAKQYIVGLQLYVQNYTCSDGHGKSYSIELTNTKKYFILDTESQALLSFDKEQHFLNKLTEFEIIRDIELDYQAFDRIWAGHKGYSTKTDFSNCTKTEP